MKRLIHIHIFIFLLVLSGCSDDKKIEATAKPNIILILTDDQGFGDLGYYGNPIVKTPVIDSLASKSVRFDEFLVSPVCAPTRASIMTGRYAMRTGVYDTQRGGSLMATSEITIAELLQEANYKTGIIGKWHLGDNYPMRPQDQGFDYTLNHLSGGIGQPGDWPNTINPDSSYYNPTLWKNGTQVKTEGYCSDVFGTAAIDFVEENKDNPFFLYLSFNAPHTPLQVPQEYYDLYKDVDVKKAFKNDSKPFPNMYPKANEYARKVYGMVTNIDDNLGRLFKKLQELNIDENTLVIFMTDNGPQDPRYIAGLRGKKSSVFQGGIKVPSFWYFPSKFKTPRDVKTTVAHLDILPTLAEFCGIELPKDNAIDGVSLMPLLTDENATLKSRTINNYWSRKHPVKYKNISTTKDSLKLVALENDFKGSDTYELFNIKNDPYELHDISNSDTLKVKEMKSEMKAWIAEMLHSENFIKTPRPIIGTKHENPLVLNLNDALYHREEGVRKPIASWEVNFSKTGNYAINVHTYAEIDEDSQLLLKVGNTIKQMNFKKPNSKMLMVDSLKVDKGDIDIMAEIFTKKDGEDLLTMPLYLEVKSLD
ncbi:arylsulfatase [Cellulophaga baltica]|uniref:arylsulfatase n=1 Tax=Cellulophaga TaxID=104264 RepID=UPI001C07D474|nr:MULTISPECIES: arylsulfatase [Cellulophaga]MBU2997989.1 arylsulfatase [Cellulophaga baltica]MDO6769390.1 arylsulfatase [Cellulophaga sp. 1_MG-2023]